MPLYSVAKRVTFVLGLVNYKTKFIINLSISHRAETMDESS